MITVLLGFFGLYLAFGIIGLLFKLTFKLISRLFLLVLGVGSFLLASVFMVPLLIILPAALVMCVLVLLSKLFF